MTVCAATNVTRDNDPFGPVATKTWSCSLEAGHDGVHIAKDELGRDACCWPQEGEQLTATDVADLMRRAGL